MKNFALGFIVGMYVMILFYEIRRKIITNSKSFVFKLNIALERYRNCIKIAKKETKWINF